MAVVAMLFYRFWIPKQKVSGPSLGSYSRLVTSLRGSEENAPIRILYHCKHVKVVEKAM